MKKHYPEAVKIGNNRDCMIQSWLSAWVVRDFISHSLHSVVAWFAIRDFCYLALKRKGLITDLSDKYIFGYVQRVLTSAEVLFFPRKLNPCFWRGKHDLIYYLKGILVNTILLSPSTHSMADTRQNTLFSALNIPFRLQNHLLFCTDTKI